MTSFEAAFAFVIGAEGSFTSDPRDPGNWTGGKINAGALRGTKYGISAAAFPTLDIASLTRDQAQAIYRARYWSPIAGDSLPPPVALVTFDCAVNQGVGTAAVLLQAALGVTQDGAVGPLTIAASVRYANAPAPLVLELCARRALRYAAGDIATYGLGWFRRLFAAAAQAVLP